jgi:polysaccharide biosynthesis/export protein
MTQREVRSSTRRRHTALLLSALLLVCLARAQAQQAPSAWEGPRDEMSNYILGKDDEVVIRAIDVDEFDGKPTRVDMRGNISVPFLGNVQAAGLTAAQLEAYLRKALAVYLAEPRISVTAVAYRSQPVSVIGAVNKPGLYYLTGHKTLLQTLSEAGGLNNDVAGNTIQVTRQQQWGPLPLPGAKNDPADKVSVAQVKVRPLLDGKTPEADIALRPNDVISVPRAELVYVVGAVRRAGGFVLAGQEEMSVLQALSMAQGLERGASPGRSRIIRKDKQGNRSEVSVDIKKLLSGQAPDLPLTANDILFVPSSGIRSATLRSLEAAIQVGTGVAIYRF